MKNLTFLFCFFAIQIAIAQDTFTYKTVKASSVTESTVQLEGASEQTTNFSSKSINLSAASKGGGTVNGSTIGNLSVSPTGAVTYSVPIDVPPGINGIQPEIALAYNSQSGNGLAGWGWNVSGISVITRIPSTLFHDNQIDAVDFDSNDRFTLDGQRLILKIGTYGANGAEYQTESYSNIKITSHGTHHTSGIAGPSYFKVYYPDGSIAFYGQNTNSRGRNDYAITYWENPQGIRINYSYNTIQNSLRIYKISYGHRGTASPINEIEFVYGDRKRDEQSYINGTRFIRNTILKEINVRGQGGTAYRNYVIQHSETSLGYERVTSVQEKTGDNSDSRNAITFTYGNTPTSTSRVDRAGLTVQNIEQRNAKVIPLDMSGNGKMDFIVYPTTGTDARKKFWLFNDIQNAGGINFYNEANTGRFQEIFPVTWLNYDYKLLPNQGLAIIQNSGNTQVKFKVYSSGSAAQPIAYKYEKIWDAPTYLDYPIFQCDLSFETRIEQEYLSGDFDGDGLSDVVAISKPYSQEACTFNQSTNECNCQYNYVTPNSIKLIKLDRRLTTNFASSIGGFSGGPYKSSDQLLTFDANGDGKTDILRFQDGKVQVYSLNPSNSSLTLLWETSDSRINLDYPILPGDYNGDGKTDFIIPTADNSLDFATFLSRGNSFVKDVKLEPFQYKEMDYNGQGTLYGYNLIPVDINGDGRTDIIDYRTTTYNNSSNGTQNIRIYQNFKPSSTSSNPRFIFSGSTSKTGDLKHYPIPVFLSSDRPNNNLDFASISDNHVTSFVFNKDHREDVAMQQVTNNGVTTTIKYDQVNPYYNGGGDPYYFPSYSAGYGEVYPFINVNVAPSFKVVRELEQNGSGLTRNQKFYYKGAVSHATGLGFVGFQELKRSNWYGDGVGTLWNISKHDPMLRGAVTEQIVANSSSSNPSQYQSKVNYFYDYKLIANPGSPSAPQYMENITRSSSISGAQTDFAEQTITFLPGFHAIGANGNYHAYIFPPSEQPGDVGYAGAVDIRLKRMETDNGLTGVSTTETYSYDAYNNPLVTNTSFTGGNKATTYQYYNNASASNNTYHIGRVKTMTERITLNGNSFNTEEQYAYSNNLVTQVKKRGNGTNWLTEDFTHDVYGNVLTKTLTASGLSPRTETFEYSATYGGRFLTKSIDIEGLETTFSYTSATGNLVSTTNPYGLTTSYINDKWDRVDRMTDYLNNHTDYTYTPLVGGGQKNTVDHPDGGMEETIYNAFGWITKSGTLSLNSQWIYKSYEYDVSGRKKRESEPHNGSPNQWNTYTFDEYGRPVTQTLYTGKNINYTYSGLSTTVNDGTKSVTSTLDALGNTVQLQDPGGSIDYTYFANGTLKTADYGGNVVTVGIDGWGRKTSLNDPSAGNYTYEYNDFGELLEETTPKGTTTYVYDAFGKVTSKTMTGDLTDHSLNYVYDNATKQVKTINGLDNTNTARAYTYQYTYDTYQRPATIKENTGFASFEQRFTYDGYGRVSKETMISNLTGGASKTLVTRNEYDTSGILTEIWNDGTPDKLWELASINARGQALTVNLGNGITKTKVYDAYGYLTKIEDKESGTNPTVALHMEYDFHQQRGILNSRENFGFNWQETFTHDNQDRLTGISGDVAHTKTYLNNGNIATNSALGDYEYGDTSKKYRLTEIDPNTTGATYFEQHPTQQISYNAFKKPIDIHQTGHGRVSFEYGPLMNRSTAYYGGEDEDKALRRYKKHYSAIIPVEIVEDTQANTTKIITYVAGDAYTAPIAHIKTTGTGAVDEYHYLHRDYLGSILAITDADGDVKEELHFGAWGSVDQFMDSGGGTTFGHDSLLGRGYTGHEHFFEVSLIHMNGRMYDAQLGRFLSPDNFVQDPYNTQNYNRYGYVMNSPLRYTDTSGELLFSVILVGALIGAATAGAAYIGSAIKTGSWNWGDFGISLLGGAAIGALTAGQLPASISISYVTSTVVGGLAAGVLPSLNLGIGNWNFGISPAIAFGKAGGIGANLSVGFNDGNFSASAGIGASFYGSAFGTGKSGWEFRKSWGVNWDDGKNGFGIYSTKYSSGETSQTLGGFNYRNGDFNLRYENDFIETPLVGIGKVLADGYDRYRTTAASVGWKEFSLNLKMFTGDPTKDSGGIIAGDEFYPGASPYGGPNGSYQGANANKYRLGFMSVGYKGYQMGRNSEVIRNFWQNSVIHDNIKVPRFPVSPLAPNETIFQYQSSNRFSLW